MTNFQHYLKSLDLEHAEFLDRIEDSLSLCKELCPENILDIFISEYIDSDGKRIYESIWGISEKYILEVKDFRLSQNIDICNYPDQVAYIDIQMDNYNLKDCIENSRMSVRVRFKNALAAQFKASGNNCAFLKDIIFNYFRKYI